MQIYAELDLLFSYALHYLFSRKRKVLSANTTVDIIKLVFYVCTCIFLKIIYLAARWMSHDSYFCIFIKSYQTEHQVHCDCLLENKYFPTPISSDLGLIKKLCVLSIQAPAKDFLDFLYLTIIQSELLMHFGGLLDSFSDGLLKLCQKQCYSSWGSQIGHWPMSLMVELPL